MTMTTPKTETLGEKLLRYRTAAGLTIPELSTKSGVATGTISNAENDRDDLRVSTLTSLLSAMGRLHSFRF